MTAEPQVPGEPPAPAEPQDRAPGQQEARAERRKRQVPVPGDSSAVDKRRTLVTVGIGYGMVILDRTIVNVGLPTIGDELDAGVVALQWVVDGYVLVLASLLLSGGAIGDRLGTARVFRLAVALFTVASVGCGAAPTAGVLVAARVLQGVGAALLMPASWALIVQAYPDTVARARALALWGAVAGSPQALGPTVGGVLVTATGWRSIFYLNLPLGLATLLLASRGLPERARRALGPPGRPRGLDIPGQALAVVLAAALTVALIEGGASGWGRPLPLLAGVAAVLSVVALARWERRTAEPVLPPALLRAPGLAAFASVGVMLFFSYYGLVFAVSLYLGAATDDTALQIGLTLLPAALPIVAVPPLATRLVTRLGTRRLVALGGTVAALGCLGLTTVDAHSSPVLLGAALLVTGVGAGTAFLPQASLVLAAAPVQYSGVVSGLMNASRQFGSMIGVAVLGALAVAAPGRVGGGEGLHLAALAAAAVMLLAAVVAVRARGSA